MLLVSIIIPICNAESYLAAALDSVLSQTYRDWELILINDGSTDQSGEICSHYAAQYGNRIRVIHQDKMGIKNACNVGLNEAKGEYVIFMNADDFVIPRCVEFLCSKLQESGADMVGASYVRITPFMNTIIQKVFYRDEIYTANNMHHFLEKHMDFICTVWGKLFRKSLIDEYNIKFNEEMGLDDEKLFLCSYAVVCKKIASLSQVVYYRCESVSATRRVFNSDVKDRSIEMFQRFADLNKINTMLATNIPRFLLENKI